MKKSAFFLTVLSGLFLIFGFSVSHHAAAQGCYTTAQDDFICNNFTPDTGTPPPPQTPPPPPQEPPPPDGDPLPDPEGGGYWTVERSRAAVCISQSDNAGGGYCAKGVANIMTAMGYPVARGDAYNWKNSLPANGWNKVDGATPTTCPPGGILVYDRNNPPGAGGGARYGHVEIVTQTPEGGRKYVSDKARSNWGGTVPNNYVGCYVYPNQTIPTGEYQQCMNGVE